MHTMDFTRDLPREGQTPATPAGAPDKAVNGLSAPIASRLQRVEAAAHPQPKLELEVKDPKLATLTAKHADVAARLRLFVAEEDIEPMLLRNAS